MNNFKASIQFKRTDEIKPYEKNSKIHSLKQIQKVAQSISALGFTSPLIIDKDNILISGHCRLESAKLLGLQEVPCILRDDLSKAETSALRLADNLLGEFSTYDRENIFKELEDLRLHDYSIEAVGISEDEIDKLSKDIESALEKTKNKSHAEKTEDEAETNQLILSITFKDEGEMRAMYEELIERGMLVKIFA